jgi:hypothetical protein
MPSYLFPVDQHWIDATATYLSTTFGSVNPLFSKSSPGFPRLHVFIRRIVQISNVSLPVFAVAHLYLTRLTQMTQEQTIAKVAPDTPHRLFIAAVLIASKMCNDQMMYTSGSTEASLESPGAPGESPEVSPSLLSTICGVYSTRDILLMERVFCKSLRYRCWVSPKQLAAHVRTMCSDHQKLEALGAPLLHLLLEFE